MFKGLSEGWPGESVHPALHPPAGGARARLRTGQPGLSRLHEPRLQRARSASCSSGSRCCATSSARTGPAKSACCVHGKAEPKGGCPVKIHIPEMLDLLGNGKLPRGAGADRELQSAAERHRPRLPAGTAVPGRLHAHQAADRDRPARVVPAAARQAGEPRTPTAASLGCVEPLGQRPTKPPIAVVGSGPSGLINAYLLAVEGFPVTVFEAFHDLGGVLRYGIPEFRLPNELIDDVVEQDHAARRPLRAQLRRRQDRDARGPQGRRLLEDLRRHRRGPADAS